MHLFHVKILEILALYKQQHLRFSLWQHRISESLNAILKETALTAGKSVCFCEGLQHNSMQLFTVTRNVPVRSNREQRTNKQTCSVMQSGKKQNTFLKSDDSFYDGTHSRFTSHGLDQPEVKVAKQQQHGRGVKSGQISQNRAIFFSGLCCFLSPPTMPVCKNMLTQINHLS